MIPSRNMQAVKRIAIVAHENKKPDLIDWSFYNKKFLIQHEIIATAATGTILEGTLEVPVRKLLSGAVGGYHQLNEMIAEGQIDVIIFFWDAQLADSHVEILQRSALAHNIATASNRTTADFLLTSVLMNQEHPIYIHDYSTYLKKNLAAVTE